MQSPPSPHVAHALALKPHAAAPICVSQRPLGWQHPKRQLLMSQPRYWQAPNTQT